MPPGTAWRAVAAMFILNGALFGIWASRIPAVAERHELGPGSLGGLLLLMAAGAIVAFPVAGKLSDNHGAARTTWRTAFLYIAALFLIAMSPDFLSLAIALFMFGATHGAMDVAMNTWAGEAERRIGRPVMSSFHAMFSLGAGMGAASGFVAASNGFEITPHFIAAGLLIAVVTLPFASIGWQPDPMRTQIPGPIFVLPKGPLFFVGAIAFCASIGEGGMADWSAILLVLSTGADEAQAALGYSVFSVAMVATRLLGDRITLTFGPVTAARLAGTTAASGVLVAVIPGTYAMTLAGFALMGIGYAIIMPLAFSRAANDPELSPGAAIASVSTLGYGGILLGPPVIGFAAEAMSLPAAFLILAALAGLIVVLGGSVAGPEPVKPAE
ncbi:Inner membrane protein YbjJ [Roseibium album]|nr:Inner membrane protein YbjJ [Roseibium album]